MSRKTRSHWILKEVDILWETRCKKSWDRFEEYDSHSLRNVKQVSGKTKDHRLNKHKIKIPHQRSPYALNFEDRSQEETERQQRCARSKAWNLGKKYTSSKKRTRPLSTRPRKIVYWWLHPQKEPEERDRVCGRFWSWYAYGQQERH